MISKHQIFTQKQLLVVRYEGVFCIDTYKQHVLYLVQTPEWAYIDKIFVDLRFVEISFNVDDIATFVDIKKNVIKKYHTSVQLVDKPMITALSHLVQSEFSNLDLSAEYCSTFGKAIELLNVDFKEDEVAELLDNLEITF